MVKVIVCFLLCIALTSCTGIRRTYNIKGTAKEVQFEYSDSVQQFNTLKKQ